MSQIDLEKTVKLILEKHKLGFLKNYRQLKIGYNRIVICVNDEYVIKICFNNNKKSGIQREIDFYETDSNRFHPKMIAYDLSIKNMPFIYTVEEKIDGKNLFDIWEHMNANQKEDTLNQIIAIMKLIHSVPADIQSTKASILIEFESAVGKVIESGLLTKDKINYLNTLKENIEFYFLNVNYGMIHGDIHFNNLIYFNGEVKVVDFECYRAAPLDKEFDPIFRMVRNPNSLLQQEYQKLVNPNDYKMIKPFLKENYPEICNLESFDERVLIYDCLNSLRWYLTYPNHSIYNETLFDRSKSLIKK